MVDFIMRQITPTPVITTRGCTRASSIWGTPCRDWPIGFKSSKSIFSWINLGISTTRGCTRASSIWGTPRFTEVDTSSANNDNGGFYNASNHPNAFAFATLQADGSIKATRGCTRASSIWGTPRRDWPIGFKSSKSIFSWINSSPCCLNQHSRCRRK
jgi:type IV secretory pathway VirB3-like protein